MINPERYVVYISPNADVNRAPGIVLNAIALELHLFDKVCGRTVARRCGGPAHMSFGDFRAAIEDHDLACDLERMMNGESERQEDRPGSDGDPGTGGPADAP